MNSPDKDERIVIRCTEETKTDFGEFAAGYRNQAEAVKEAVRVWKRLPGQFKRRNG